MIAAGKNNKIINTENSLGTYYAIYLLGPAQSNIPPKDSYHTQS